MQEDVRYFEDVQIGEELPIVRKEITLANMENCCCEFRKYWTAREGYGSLRRFTPSTG